MRRSLPTLLPNLQFQLQRYRPIHPVANRRNNKHISANAIAFPCKSGESGCEPATAIGLWVAIKATQDSPKFDRPNCNRLVVDASVIGVFAVAIVKTPNRGRGYGTKAVFRTSAPIAVIVVLALIKVLRHKTGVDPNLTTRFRLHN